MSFSAFLLVFLAPSLSLQDPVTLSGRVVTGAAKAPVGNAVVTVLPAGEPRSVTDQDGRFALSVPPGPLRLDVGATGLANQRVDVTVVQGLGPLEIVLVAVPTVRQEVTVTAAALESPRTSATIELAPSSIQQVAGAADNIFKALQTLPGVSATDDFGSRLAVRGGGPDQNLTVMDGVEIHNPYRLFGLQSAFNPETVERFELTAGGFGAAYGDRLSSILVVDNRQGTTTERLDGSVNLSLFDANLLFEGKLPGRVKGSWLATGRRTYYDLVAEHITHNKLPSFEDFQAKVVWDTRPGQRLTFFTLRSRERTDAEFTDSATSDPADEPDRVAVGDTSRNDVAAVTYTAAMGSRASSRTIVALYDYNDSLSLDANVRNGAQRTNTPGPNTSRAVIVFTRDLAVRDVSVRQETSIQAGRRHLVATGFDAHMLRTIWGWTISGDRNIAAANGSSVIGGTGLPSLLLSRRNTTRSSAWLEDRFEMAPNLRIEPGVRLDWSGVAGEMLASPRLGLRWELTPRTRVRGALGRYTQSAGYEKLLQSDYFVDLTSEAARHLTSARSVHVLGALERDVTPSVTARVETYYKTFDKLVIGRLETPDETAARVGQYAFPPELASSVPTAAEITSVPGNGGGGRAYGFDVYVERPQKTRSDRLSGWASYTWGVADIDGYGRRYPFDYDRRHAVSVVGTWGLASRLDWSGTLRIASGFPTTPGVGVRVASMLAPGAVAGSPRSLIPAKDAQGLYAWNVDLGGIPNLNSERLPLFARLDVRVSFKPKNPRGRWLFYVEVLNTFNRSNASQAQPELRYDPGSDRPRVLSSVNNEGFPRLPSFGFRFKL